MHTVAGWGRLRGTKFQCSEIVCIVLNLTRCFFLLEYPHVHPNALYHLNVTTKDDKDCESENHYCTEPDAGGPSTCGVCFPTCYGSHDKIFSLIFRAILAVLFSARTARCGSCMVFSKAVPLATTEFRISGSMTILSKLNRTLAGSMK